jgi:hypothetical protein
MCLRETANIMIVIPRERSESRNLATGKQGQNETARAGLLAAPADLSLVLITEYSRLRQIPRFGPFRASLGMTNCGIQGGCSYVIVRTSFYLQENLRPDVDLMLLERVQ